MPNLTVARNTRFGEAVGAVRIVAIVVWFLTTGSGHAGFYDPRQPTSPLVSDRGIAALPFPIFKDELDAIVRIGDPLLPSKKRDEALARRKSLLDRGIRTLTGDELAELGLLQHRLRESDNALQTLTFAMSRDPRNFWVFVHLGSLYQANGQYQDAPNYLATAPSFFPTPWPVQPAAGAWFKACERMQLLLLRRRLREGYGRGGVRPPPPADVDDLFDGVRFTGPNGEYTAGAIDPAMKAKLPPDAIATVQQLLLWFPEDTRLFWLLGELYNADGDIDSASAIFSECVWGRRFNAPALSDHRRTLREAIDERVPSQTHVTFLPEGKQLWMVVAGAGTLFALFGYWQVREVLRRFRR